MNFDDYQEKASETAVYPKKYSLAYVCLGLNGEAGEVAEKVKKWLRKGYDLPVDLDYNERIELADELGDVLWYVAMVAEELGIPLSMIARRNVHKLGKRKEEGKLKER